MTSKFRRRYFLKQSCQVGLVTSLSYPLISCGIDETEESTLFTNTVTKDIFVRQCGIIPYEFLKEKRPLTLHFREPGHRHRFQIGPKEYDQILAGRSVKITTEKMWGHDHTVTLSLNNTVASTFTEILRCQDQDTEEDLDLDSIITKTDLEKLEPVVKTFTHDGHTHNFMLETSDLCALRAAIKVRNVSTSISNDHNHIVSI